MGKLSVLRIRSLKEPGRYGDGDGLWLQVRSPENKSWLFRYVSPVTGKPRVMGLGPEQDVTLAEARDAAREARRLVLRKVDPLDAKAAEATARKEKTAAGRTFKDLAIEYVAAHRDGWKNPKHAAQWMATLEAHAFPKIGGKAVSDITTDHVFDILEPIWTKTPETASRLRGRIEAVLAAAIARGFRSGPNPADWKGALKPRLAPVAKLKKAAGSKSHPALPWQQAPSFMVALAVEEGLAAKALRFAILTAARSGEVRGATWGEIDLDQATWIIPGERMKVGKLHRVPLSAEAITLLKAIPRLSTDSKSLVFPGTMKRDRKEQPLSDMSLSAVVRRMNGQDGGPRWLDQLGQPVVPHGFRSSFRDWVSEATSYPGEIAEAALAHVLKNKVEASYSRTDHLERRRSLMAEWGAFLAGGSAAE